MGQKGWDPGSETTVLKSAVDVKAPKKGVVGTFGQRIQKNKVHGLVSHVIQGPQKDQKVAAWIRNLKDMLLEQSTSVFHGITLA